MGFSTRRGTAALDCWQYGEESVAERLFLISVPEFFRICDRVAELMYDHDGMLGKLVASAAVEVVEGRPRALARKRRRVVELPERLATWAAAEDAWYKAPWEARRGQFWPGVHLRDTTHVWSMNNSGESQLGSLFDDPMEEIALLLETLNGSERCAFLLWKLPDGQSYFDLSKDDPARGIYIQTAGDYKGRMSLEVREFDDGIYRQYAVGRAREADKSAVPDQAIRYADHEVLVRPNEVLDGPEVLQLFLHYLKTGEILPGYTRRELDI